MSYGYYLSCMLDEYLEDYGVDIVAKSKELYNHVKSEKKYLLDADTINS